jgi:hypothetical protein
VNSSGRPTTIAASTVAPLARVAGDRICVLEMVADVGAIEDALLIRVGPDRD